MNETSGDSGLVKDCTSASFRADVISESGRQPVLVDFWAPWCAPCQQLTPVLEKIVRKAGGKVKLVKMNIEEHPQIAGQLGVQSIPAVFAFQKGQPVDGFLGALPEGQIKGFLERLVGPLGGEDEEIIADGFELLSSGKAEESIGAFLQALEIESGNPKAIAGLARAYLMTGDLVSARVALDSISPGFENDKNVAAARAAVENAEQAESVGELGELEQKVASNPKDFQARLDLAIALNARGDREPAADLLLDIIKRERNWNDDAARKQLLQFFEAWGQMDPETLAARRKLSTALYS